MACIQETGEAASRELAEKRGNFPAFHQSVFPGLGVKRRRNATVTTVALTGTISILSGVRRGIEPVFSYEVKRRIANELYTDVHPIYGRYLREGKRIDKRIFQTAWDTSGFRRPFKNIRKMRCLKPSTYLRAQASRTSEICFYRRHEWT